MDPMYLPEVEKAFPPGPPGEGMKKLKESGAPVPQILHLIAYRPEKTRHLLSFTQEVMRGPSLLSPGLRELIAAYTSKRNDCLF